MHCLILYVRSNICNYSQHYIITTFIHTIHMCLNEKTQTLFMYSISNTMNKTTFEHLVIFLLFFSVFAGAQPSSWGQSLPQQPYSSSLAIIVAVLAAALFFMGFLSVYVRHCGGTAGNSAAIRRAISIHNRRAAEARGLDASVIETFPTFTYSEVKDHHIGKGALECAVCLNEFQDEETLRLIPKCDHVFHPECIDMWLGSHVTCPVCRANLVPQLDDEPVLNDPVDNIAEIVHSSMERNDSRNEVVIDIPTSEPVQVPKLERGASFEHVNRPQRSWSMKVFGFVKFRSHSTGHSLVQPGNNLDRYTLRLPMQVRKDMMNRKSLSRIGSYASTLPRERSSKSGFRGEGSGRAGKSYRRVDREAKSDRWVIFTRALSMKSFRIGGEIGQGSSNESRNPVIMPSFKCLEPKSSDEAGLIAGDQLAKSSV